MAADQPTTPAAPATPATPATPVAPATPVPSASSAATPRTARVTDPRTMRALAHPLRLRLLGELRMRGPQSVGMLGDLVDEAPGSISYHIGKLAEFGFVEPVPELARDRRERWWRAAHEMTSWEPLENLEDADRRTALGVLRRAVLHRYLAGLEEYLQAEASTPADWVRAAVSSDVFLHLTSDELAELRADLEELAARWQARSNPDRDGVRTVTLIYHAFPRPEGRAARAEGQAGRAGGQP
jgi:DNA-binding transcriptional ArsR family regulator